MDIASRSQCVSNSDSSQIFSSFRLTEIYPGDPHDGLPLQLTGQGRIIRPKSTSAKAASSSSEFGEFGVSVAASRSHRGRPCVRTLVTVQRVSHAKCYVNFAEAPRMFAPGCTRIQGKGGRI